MAVVGRSKNTVHTFFLFVLSAISILTAAPAEEKVPWDIRNYGAVGDGSTLNTKAFQAAIDACHTAGGGTILIPPGDYVTGTVILRSHITLHLESGARISGSQSIEDYPVIRPAWRSYTDNYNQQALFHAEKIDDIHLEGFGTIDGRGGIFHYKKPRPFLFRFIECTNISLREATLRDGGYWTVHFLACSHVLVDGITIRGRCNRNNDGLDIDSSENVRISNCDINSEDDAIVMKSTSDRPTRQVAITNCLLSSSANALKAGTESNGGFQQITISNCVVYDTWQAGVALEIVDGGHMEGITVSNITMRNVTVPIFIRLGDRARPFLTDGPRPEVGAIRRLSLENITATEAGPIGCAITGIPGHPLESIRLSHIQIQTAGGGKRADIFREIPEYPDRYPEGTMFGLLPAYGFYLRHADGIRLDDIQLSTRRSDLRPAIALNDVHDFSLSALSAPGHPLRPMLIYLRNTQSARIAQCTAPEKENVFLRIAGKDSRNIFLWGNDLRNAKRPWILGKGLSSNILQEK